MIPGPVPLSYNVRSALSSAQRPHYGTEWATLWHAILDKLALVFGTTGTILNIPGSGSAGLDAVVNSIIGPGDRVLVGVNGYHGARLAAIAESRGADVVKVSATWGDPVLPQQFAELASTKPPRLIILTHVETSTGVANPVPEIVDVARRVGAMAMIDAVASLGGMEFRMDDWGIDIACASSQKCLGSTPGLAQVALSPRALLAINERKEVPRSWYLDLGVWLEFNKKWASWHPYPVTVPTGTTLALSCALDELMRDGLQARFAHLHKVGEYLKEQMLALGLEPLTSAKSAAPMVTALKVGAGRSSNELIDFLRTEHRIHVGAGFGPLDDRIIRVGHMSPIIKVTDIDKLADAVRMFIRRAS
jgi:alanine-glyoxylate transaminase / serine-glyoxylate transaminase / serine-pyruvate transaminase